MIYTESLAARLTPGETWRPSNGTEGELFTGTYCNRCKHDAEHRDDTGAGCGILIRTWAYEIDDPKYPTEWQIGTDGQPMCTEFEAEADR